MKINLHDNEQPEVSMSPLIDCVFLLLIFFLVASMAKVKNKDISVDLPESEAAIQLRPHDNQVVIGIDPDSQLYWEGSPCTTNFLLEQLRDLCIEDPERQIRVDMDKEAPFGRFVEVMDACQFYDLKNVGIRTFDESYNRD
ncbi:biopolymer transport protein ExbD [Haloferula luteola]|uniref:Biopolymer transport protein ExbD n=1 Tax=Haloferula luteola TaxID=595692 RepID=A0A840V7Z5_9BACT|nr:biopolymer transport protein ExbD [Haloferula luteola]